MTPPTTPPTPAPAQKTYAELAKDAFDYKGGDYIFDGTMEAPARFDVGSMLD